MEQSNNTKICVVASSFVRYEGDYVGRRIYDLVNILSHRYEIHVIYLKYPTTIKETGNVCRLYHSHPIRYPYKIYPLSEVSTFESLKLIPLFVKMLTQIKRVVKSHNIDLIHAHWGIPSGFLASLAGGKIPLITTVRGLDVKLQTKQRIFQPFVKYALKKSTRIIALSDKLKQEATELGIAADKIHVIPGGVDMRKFQPFDKSTARARFRLPEGFILLFVGSLFRIKRVDRLIKVSARLFSDFNFHVLIVGDGPERANLEKLARDLKLKNILFIGRVSHDDVPLYMTASDVLVLPSESEGLPGCVQEAMACGVPVVASNVGGLPDIIKNETTGFLINDESEMETSLRLLMSSPQLAATIGRNALEFARSNLSLEKVAGQTEDLYASVLNERKANLLRG